MVAFVAGVIDAIAGGGGLLVVPALLVAVGDPRVALGTSKGQSVFGAFASLLAYYRAGRVDRRRALASFGAALLGSLLGVRLVLSLRPALLRPVVLGLLCVVLFFFALRGRGGASSAQARRGWRIAEAHPTAVAAVIGLALGLYDGFFGPGTGTFLIVLFVTIFGDNLTQATANAKVANFASNVGAVVSFAVAGAIDFRLALPMAAAQTLGGVIGARAALRGGDRLIRAAVLLVAAALAIRIAWQMTH
jgi:uncharacterized membrane protein YfcA